MNRIKKYYGKESKIIYPPIMIEKPNYKKVKEEDYFLFGIIDRIVFEGKKATGATIRMLPTPAAVIPPAPRNWKPQADRIKVVMSSRW